jgi:hypothetical protein
MHADGCFRDSRKFEVLAAGLGEVPMMAKMHCDKEYWKKPPSGVSFCDRKGDTVLGDEDFKKTAPKRRCKICELHLKGSHFYAMAMRGEI